MCDVLGFEHREVYNRPQIFPTPDAVREKLPYYCHSIRALIKNIMRFVMILVSIEFLVSALLWNVISGMKN
jgi:hypothetical protein